MNSEKELYTKIISSLNSDLARSKKKIIWIIFCSLFIIWVFHKEVFAWCILIFIALIAWLSWSFWSSIILLIFASILVSPLYYFIFKLIQYRQKRKNLQIIKEVNSLIKNTFKTEEDIINILNLTEKTADALKKALSLGLNKKKNDPKSTRIYYENQVLFFYLILSNLRSDLQIHLEKQEKLLESAKLEVSENIHWTSELAQVSELQKMRLDKQIGQFEELQRVLVKR